jgi:hypothetical protein
MSTNRRYLVDQNNVPFHMVGYDAQPLICNLTHADADLFFANRTGFGFNSFWIDLLCYRGGGTNGGTFDGSATILPFTTPGDISTPNEAYFARVDDRIRLAEQYGLNVVLNPAETVGTLQLLINNGVTKDRAYGQYLGNRYRSFNNIIWMSGNDLQNWSDPAVDAVVQAVALGIKDTDTRHIHTVELDYYVSDSFDDPTWIPLISLNAPYTYYPTYAEVLVSYNRSGFVPVFMVEANYEFENNTGQDPSTPNVLRRQEYWTMLSGATGQQYGSHWTSGPKFQTGWQSNLNTPGATQMGYLASFFNSRPWYDLIPDQTHVVMTAGYGTFSSTGSVHANDYATTARTSDGRYVIAYVPTNRTVTVDASKLSGPITARWYDPSSNTYRSIAGSPFANSGSLPFSHPGNNSDGTTDWLLVLESLTTPTPSPTSTPGGPSPTATPILSPTPTPTAAPLGLSFPSTAGVITTPFVINNNAVSQPTSNDDPTLGGRAFYAFNVPTSGDYLLSVLVNCPDGASNSFFVNIDAEPSSAMIWSIPVTSGLENRIATWVPSTTPKVWTLSAGTHQLIIRGREANTILQHITLGIAPAAPEGLHVVP